MGQVAGEERPRPPHFIFFSSKMVPVFLPRWEVEIPEIFIVVEDKEKVEEASEADHAEEQHKESVEQLDHVPVYALTPAKPKILIEGDKNWVNVLTRTGKMLLRSPEFSSPSFHQFSFVEFHFEFPLSSLPSLSISSLQPHNKSLVPPWRLLLVNFSFFLFFMCRHV